MDGSRTRRCGSLGPRRSSPSRPDLRLRLLLRLSSTSSSSSSSRSSAGSASAGFGPIVMWIVHGASGAGSSSPRNLRFAVVLAPLGLVQERDVQPPAAFAPEARAADPPPSPSRSPDGEGNVPGAQRALTAMRSLSPASLPDSRPLPPAEMTTSSPSWRSARNPAHRADSVGLWHRVVPSLTPRGCPDAPSGRRRNAKAARGERVRDSAERCRIRVRRVRPPASPRACASAMSLHRAKSSPQRSELCSPLTTVQPHASLPACVVLAGGSESPHGYPRAESVISLG
jgi:hypothetical protein